MGLKLKTVCFLKTLDYVNTTWIKDYSMNNIIFENKVTITQRGTFKSSILKF